MRRKPAADLVPRVPAVIPQLLRSLRDDSMSGADLSRQLAQDVVLVAEVIREANSPYYRPAAPIKTIEGAVMLLGQNGMRMLLARVAFRPIISSQSGPFALQAAPLVWRQSEACALAGQHAGAPAGRQSLRSLPCRPAAPCRPDRRAAPDRPDLHRPALPHSDDFCTPCWRTRACCRPASPRCGNSPRRYATRSSMPASPADRRWRRHWRWPTTSPCCACWSTPAVIGADHPSVLALDPAARAVFEKLSTEED